MISITLDDGKTWIPCPEGVRVNIERQWISGEDSQGDLVFNFTDEGVITDIWTLTEAEIDSNVGTNAEMYSEIIAKLVAENS